MTIKKILVAKSLIASFLLLNGCGSETQEAQLTPSLGSIAAFNKLATAPINTLTRIDLTSSVNGQEVFISEMSSDTPEKCLAQTDGSLTVGVEIYEQDRCDYTYVAEDNAGNKTKAKLVLMESSKANNILSTISKNLVFGDSTSINLAELLGDRVTNYKITSAIAQDELGAEPLSALTNDEVLTFDVTAPSSLGWHLISYELAPVVNRDADFQATERGANLVGEIFISVADNINQPPIINIPSLIYTGDSFALGKDDNIAIDLANISCHQHFLDTFSGCYSVTSDTEWQLTNVKSISADVSIEEYNAEDVKNKTFHFATDIPSAEVGHHDLTYIVSNHKGATNIGTMRVYTENEKIEFGKTWRAIEIDVSLAGDENNKWDNLDWFLTGTYTHLQGIDESENYSYHSEWLERSQTSPKSSKNTNKVPHLIAKWTKIQAENFCEGLSDKTSYINLRLPTSENLQKAVQTNSAAIKFWPKELPYFVKDYNFDNREYEIKLYNLDTASLTSYTEGDFGYITCLQCVTNYWLDRLLCWLAELI